MSKKLIGDISRGYAMVDAVYAENIEMMEKIERAISRDTIENDDLARLNGFNFKNATAKKIRHDETTGATGIFWDDGGDTVVAVMAIPRQFADAILLEQRKEITNERVSRS